MHFPGSSYRLFVIARSLGPKYLALYAELGHRRFFYPKRMKRGKPSVRFARIALAGHSVLRDGYELAYEREDHVEMWSSEGMERLPIWRLGSDPIEALVTAASEHRLVFVENPWQQLQAAAGPVRNHQYTSAHARKLALRELWETAQRFPDKLIVYGIMNFQLYYCFGLAGSVRMPRKREPFRGGHSTWDVTGRRFLFDAFDLESVASDLGLSKRWWNDELAVSTALNRGIPIYVKHLYEDLDRSSSEVKEAIRQAIRLYGNRKPFPVETLLYSSPADGQPASGDVWTTWNDKWVCDHCAIAYACRLYKKGSVCTMPDSEGYELALRFASRNVEDVIEGISATLVAQAMMLEDGIRARNEKMAAALDDPDVDCPVVDAELNKLMNDVQRNGVQYARLVDPSLTNRRLTLVPDTAGGEILPAKKQIELTPRLFSETTRELVSAGTARELITPSMVKDFLIEKNGGALVVDVVPPDDSPKQDW